MDGIKGIQEKVLVRQGKQATEVQAIEVLLYCNNSTSSSTSKQMILLNACSAKVFIIIYNMKIMKIGQVKLLPLFS